VIEDQYLNFETRAEMSVSRSQWGTGAETESLELIEISNEFLRLRLTNAGAAIVSLETQDRDGNWANIVVSGAEPSVYLDNTSSLGATVGRYGNRIANGKFELDGTEYELAVNNGPNHLHGGNVGFAKRLWVVDVGEDEVTFSYHSPGGEEGYPGTLQVQAIYRVREQSLEMEYRAETDAPTVLNLTNHAYWNLSGVFESPIYDHQLMLRSDDWLEADENVLVTGTINGVKDTPFDFTEPKSIGTDIEEIGNGYDHCYVVHGLSGSLRPVATVVDPKTGRKMEVLSTQPGVQLYTANHFDKAPHCGGVNKHAAFCLECQHYPDSPNHAHFPSTVLRPGEEYRQMTIHVMTVE